MTTGCRDDHKLKNKTRDPLLTILIVFLLIILIVSIGTIGYRIFANMAWIDAFHNGALVFTATTVVNPIETYEGKIFSAIYNILSAVFVLVLLGIILRTALVNFDNTHDTHTNTNNNTHGNNTNNNTNNNDDCNNTHNNTNNNNNDDGNDCND
jgi:flagellar basal body-associated protein FliL